MSAVELKHVYKKYGDKVVLNDLNVIVNEGSFNVIMGPSGSGKSTILNIIGLLDKADDGEVILFDRTAPKPFSFSAEKLLRHHIGYLFQNFALVENETVDYNLKLSLEYTKGDKKSLIKKALKKVGLSDFENKKVYQCSGGQQQRIAIARLLLKSCDLILADEPTGSLDEDNRKLIIGLLKDMQKEGKTIIVVSHDPVFKKVADKVIEL